MEFGTALKYWQDADYFRKNLCIWVRFSFIGMQKWNRTNIAARLWAPSSLMNLVVQSLNSWPCKIPGLCKIFCLCLGTHWPAGRLSLDVRGRQFLFKVWSKSPITGGGPQQKISQTPRPLSSLLLLISPSVMTFGICEKEHYLLCPCYFLGLSHGEWRASQSCLSGCVVACNVAVS